VIVVRLVAILLERDVGVELELKLTRSNPSHSFELGAEASIDTHLPHLPRLPGEPP
jgi:hypothetical protein